MIRLFALAWKVHRGWGKGVVGGGKGWGEQYALIESKVYEHLKRNKCRLGNKWPGRNLEHRKGLYLKRKKYGGG